MLEELGVSYKIVPANPMAGDGMRPDFLKLNPHGKVPCLQDGDFFLTESAAINTYLGDKFGRLVPASGTQARGSYDQWCFFIMSELDAQGLWIRRKHVDLHKLFGEAPVAVAAAKLNFQTHLDIAAEKLKKQQSDGKGPFLLGAEFTAADILMVHVLRWAKECKGWLDEPSSVISEYLALLESRPACQRTIKLATEVYGRKAQM